MWVWCPECTRCYRRSMRRWENGLPVCHYPDCSGSYLSSWAWHIMCRLKPAYPVTPKVGERYSGPPGQGAESFLAADSHRTPVAEPPYCHEA